jgi:hypothetical protein
VLFCSVWFALFADATAAEALFWFALPPAETFVADWFDVAEAVALCSVGAFWTIVCDCPEPPALPVWVIVAFWVVLLSFCADDEALEELDCSASLPGSVESAAAVPGARPVQSASRTLDASSARQRVRPFRMSSTIPDGPLWEQTPPDGFDSPRLGGVARPSSSPMPVPSRVSASP